jgi:hypothetical protein
MFGFDAISHFDLRVYLTHASASPWHQQSLKQEPFPKIQRSLVGTVAGDDRLGLVGSGDFTVCGVGILVLRTLPCLAPGGLALNPRH